MPIAYKIASIIALMFLFSFPVRAESRIAVLDFELNDITLNPRIPEEVERTASLKPLLEERLVAEGGYQIVPVNPDAQENATKSFGYLWDHPDEAAALGKLTGAQFILVGRVNKPSFLFVYFFVRLIDVRTQKIIGEFGVEVKGQQKKITPKGIENLAGQIDAKLQTLRHSQ